MTNNEHAILETRAQRLNVAKQVGDFVGGRFLLAGGALTRGEPKDFDIYGVERPLDLSAIKWRVSPHLILSNSSNAITMELCGQVVQFCNYFKSTPQKTIEAFDFAHCQAGAVFSRDGNLLEIVSTPAFWKFEETKSTWYTGSEYPLSSLMRCMKFHQRGLFKDNAHKVAAVEILCDIVRRGFLDEGDFCDQCASISETFRELNKVDAESLFELLRTKKTEEGKE